MCGVAFSLSALTERPTGWREFIHRSFFLKGGTICSCGEVTLAEEDEARHKWHSSVAHYDNSAKVYKKELFKGGWLG